MPSINIRQLRDTRRLKTWLRSGKTIELRERQEVIARIVPEQLQPEPGAWPDFAKRRAVKAVVNGTLQPAGNKALI